MRGFFIIFSLLFIAPILALVIAAKDAFAKIYEAFSFMYGNSLALHLYGWNGTDFESNSLYVPAGLILYFLTLLSVITFYYFINSIRFSRWYHWLIVFFANAILVYIITFSLPYSDYSNYEIADDIIDTIFSGDLHSWALVNSILAILLFIIFSFSLRWWSSNCSTTPIPQ